MVTEKQHGLHDFLHRFRREYGHPPTLAEIQRHFKLKSPATVHKQLAALERVGLIRRQKGVARGIELLDAPPAGDDCEIPLLGVVAAGRPIEAVLTRETACVPRDLFKGDRFALRVRGDSMMADGILDGDVIVVERRETAENGETVVALVDEAEATVKRFYRERGHIRLQPANPKYKPIIVKPPSRLRVQGAVVGLVRRYGR